ncbi:MAG: hypothetical protein R3E96_07965 [Planctomycetota bacterium]
MIVPILAVSIFGLSLLAPMGPQTSESAPQEPLAASAPGVTLTFAELDGLLLRRLALTSQGQGALRELIDLKALRHLAKQRGVSISTADLNARWLEIERDLVASGQAANMEEFLRASGVDRETFREYLELALVQETLTRQDLGLAKNAPVSPEQQKLWIDEAVKALGYEGLPPYWADGVVARVGPVEITTAELAGRLREQTEPAELRQTCYEALLEKRIRLRFPDLAPAAFAQAVEVELDQRRADLAKDPRYKGLDYEQVIATQGLSLAALRQDPAVVSAALARLWVDRTCNDECLREVYQNERDQFDGMFGEGAQTFAIRLNAGDVVNDLVPRTFDQAEAELNALRGDIHSLEDFQRLAAVRTDDIRAREAQGLVGYVRGRTDGVEAPVREAVMRALAERPGPVSGTVLGPVRVQGGMLLLCLGERAVAPTWDIMAQNVHKVLRRRFMIEQLPRPF